ncbi:MAG TPA: GNAT family N-acetyltransferase [Actinoplanes sp.]|nr:GNAT family N-acetyltransferase [Actinoplanes sp.]
MPELTAPTPTLHASWIDHRDDIGRGVAQEGGGSTGDFDVDSPEGFADWVRHLRAHEDPANPLAEGRVHCTYRWITEGDRVVGVIALRHRLNDLLLEAGGHIGYCVRPAERRRGLATWALGEMLAEARALGLARVLVTCDDDNPASAGVIERNGGVLEDVRDTWLGVVRRYWITL